MRLAYLGTPDAAVPPLEALVAAGHEIAVVVTRPDRRRGRRAEESPSPVKAAAQRLGLDVVHHPDDLLVRSGQIELGVVVAYGRLISASVLEAIPMVNLHFSALPRWRGAAPVERAILAGDPITAVCLMDVVPELDAGGVYDRVEVPIGPETTADELRADLVRIGSDLLVASLARGLGTPAPQVGEPTYAAKIATEDRRIDWGASPEAIHRLIRIGGAWTTFRGRRVKVRSASLVDGRLVLGEIQPEGRGPMSFDDWQRGVRPDAGEWFE